ncbi:MAG: hypothetical protein IKP60_07085 [Treponema sp.]|nr:hypothetical protein [Treponema sp.]
MYINLEDKEEFELVTKWLEDNPADKLFQKKLKENAPEKYKKLFEEVRERYINRK